MINKLNLLNRKFFQSIKKWKSFFLVLLFLLSTFSFTTFFTKISHSHSVIASAQNLTQLVQQAQEFYQTQQFVQAATTWQKVADIFVSQGDQLNQAMALSNLSLTQQQIRKWKQAQNAIATSLSILESQAQTSTQQSILASSLDIQGQLQLALGQADKAQQTWQQAREIYQQIGNQEGVIKSQINQAQALQNLGFYPRACQVLLNSLGFDQPDCNISNLELTNLSTNQPSSLQILALRSLGNVLRVIEQTQQSYEVLHQSWQLAQTSSQNDNDGDIYLNLGNTLHALGHQKLATTLQPQTLNLESSQSCLATELGTTVSEIYQQAVACYRQAELSPDSAIRIKAQLNLLNLLVKTQQWTTVPNLITTIKPQLVELSPSLLGITAELKLAQNLMCLHNQIKPHEIELSAPILQSCLPFPELITNQDKQLDLNQIPSDKEIEKLLNNALEQARILGNHKAEANALGYLASLSQQQGEWQKAQQLTQQALQTISAFNEPEIAYFWQWQLGRLYQIQGNTPKAISAYTLAYNLLQSLRQDLVATSADIQFSFRDSVEPVYRELVDLLLQDSQPSQESLQQARKIIESLQLAELNNFFREACIEEKPQQIDQVDSQAAVFYTIILPHKLAVILSIPNQPLSYYQTNLSSNADNDYNQELESTFNELLINLNRFLATANPMLPYQKFYDWLIRPAENELANNQINTLVFVLDGILRGLPVAALYDGEQYLVEKYNLALTPGLQLLNPQPFTPDKLNTLAGGLSVARDGFPPLPAVEQEVKDISEVVPAEVILNREFTSSQLQNRIQATSFSIVHLATHAQFSSQAENTFLLTWNQRINVKKLDQLLQETNRQNPNPIELLILSACQTAAGDNKAFLGLAGVAVRSGARSTIATLWSVEDQSTAKLMSNFYYHLKDTGVSKAEALRQAQLSLLKSSEYQHPFYWAPFVLVGSWL